jgi:predicted transcriptional regulator
MAREADFYTPSEAANLLGLAEFTILGLLTSGELEGRQDEQGRWWIPAAAVDEAARRGRGADTPTDPSVEETAAMTPISPPGSEDTPAKETPMSEETTEFEADAGSTPRTPPVDNDGHAYSTSGWTTTDQAARALGVTPRTVRRFIDRGDLEGRKVTEGIVEAWEVSIDSLYSLRDKRQSEGQVRRNVPRKSVEDHIPTDMEDYVRELTDRLVRTTSEAAELRTRLELTHKAESTLEEERDRLRQDWERERQERQEAQEEARRLREELQAERSKGFWQRLFGG